MGSIPFIIQTRDLLLRGVRSFFQERGFLEAETPIRIPAPCLEEHIEAIPADGQWLRTSPELHLKRLVAAGCGPVFCLGPCFRRGEYGRLHHPEFTMLEWYRPDAGYREILEDTRLLTGHLARSLAALNEGGGADRFCGDWLWISVAEAFQTRAGWDPVAAFDPERFDLDLVEKVEPSFKKLGAVVLYDYPAACAALARRKPGNPEVAERGELYLDGVEIANAYSELVDPVEQRARFEACAQYRREAGREVYPLDEDFLEALDRGLPACAGVALGLDRLLMVLLGKESLDAVLPFRRDGSGFR